MKHCKTKGIKWPGSKNLCLTPFLLYHHHSEKLHYLKRNKEKLVGFLPLLQACAPTKTPICVKISCKDMNNSALKSIK